MLRIEGCLWQRWAILFLDSQHVTSFDLAENTFKKGSNGWKEEVAATSMFQRRANAHLNSSELTIAAKMRQSLKKIIKNLFRLTFSLELLPNFPSLLRKSTEWAPYGIGSTFHNPSIPAQKCITSWMVIRCWVCSNHFLSWLQPASHLYGVRSTSRTLQKFTTKVIQAVLLRLIYKQINQNTLNYLPIALMAGCQKQ